MTRPVFNPFLPEVRENPFPIYAQLRREDPVHVNESAGVCFLTRHADCVAMLTNPVMSAEQGQQARQRDSDLPPSMLNADPPLHTRLRRAAAPAFASAVVDAALARVDPVIDEVLEWADEVGEIDLVSAYSGPLAAVTMMELLGIERARLAEFYALARSAAVNLDPLAQIAETDAGAVAADRLADFFGPYVDGSAPVPEISAIAVLRRSGEREDGQSIDEAAATCALAVIGGFEPLRDLVGTSVLTLLRDPALAARLRATPRLIDAVLDEFIRFDTPIGFAARVPREDTEIAGCPVRAGQTVVALLASANRDEAAFDAPDRLDFGRAHNPHLGFGAGPHYCLGAVAAKAACARLVGKLLERFPQMSLADEPLRWNARLVPRGLEALQVRLHPRTDPPDP